MIASFTNNFIFMKTAKTASSSAEIVLGSWCRDPDIVTRADKDQIYARNYADEHGKTQFQPHEKAIWVRDKLPELWGQAFKFTVERHPYERVVSIAYWRMFERGIFNWRSAGAEIDRVIRRARFLNHRFYMIDGAVVVDEIIDYDNLWPRLAELGAQWGHEMPAELPRAKSTQRKDKRPAREILTEAQMAEIREKAAWDFEHLGFAP